MKTEITLKTLPGKSGIFYFKIFRSLFFKFAIAMIALAVISTILAEIKLLPHNLAIKDKWLFFIFLFFALCLIIIYFLGRSSRTFQISFIKREIRRCEECLESEEIQETLKELSQNANYLSLQAQYLQPKNNNDKEFKMIVEQIANEVTNLSQSVPENFLKQLENLKNLLTTLEDQRGI